jgi:hypothetical protein
LLLLRAKVRGLILQVLYSYPKDRLVKGNLEWGRGILHRHVRQRRGSQRGGWRRRHGRGWLG